MSETRPAFTAGQVAQACGGTTAPACSRATAEGICTDSRTIRPGEAFVALEGPRHDGHDYVPDALGGGASMIVARRGAVEAPLGDAALVEVEDTTRALMDLAAWHRGRLRGKVLAITGSCGKSTVKTMLGTLLETVGACTAAPKSFNNRVGVSLSLLSARPEDRFVVLEMGTNHPGEIDELAGLARPHAGLITCIEECHLEGLGDREGVLEAKAELIPHLDPEGVLVLNADDELCAGLADRFPGSVKTFGLGEEADLTPTGIAPAPHGEVFEAWGWHFHLPARGRHNVLNAAAALCLARWAGVRPAAAREALPRVELPPLRCEERHVDGVTFMLDCYNSNPAAMRAALDAFLHRPVQRRRVVVCGDMLELGDKAPRLHRRLGRTLALTRIDALVAVGPLARHVAEGWNELADPDRKAVHVPSAERAWRAVWWLTAPGDGVLVKGSRDMELEKVVEEIATRSERFGRTTEGSAA